MKPDKRSESSVQGFCSAAFVATPIKTLIPETLKR